MNIPESARWTISVALLIFSLLCIIANFWISIRWYLFKQRASLIPFIGGILGMIGLLILPVPGAKNFFWLPFVVDLGCGLLLAGIVIERIKRFIHL